MLIGSAWTESWYRGWTTFAHGRSMSPSPNCGASPRGPNEYVGAFARGEPPTAFSRIQASALLRRILTARGGKEVRDLAITHACFANLRLNLECVPKILDSSADFPAGDSS